MIGRANESSVLERAFHDSESHFIAVYGRRRVGKTFLIRETFRDRFAFQHAGLYNRPLSDQLFAFDASLKDAGYTPERKSRNWMEAFEHLKDLIRLSTEKRKIIFLDELSWMDTRKSDLIAALEHFWNGWASARKDILLIICSSSSSWVLSKIIHNKGGLYNRLTERIHLQPFVLSECEEFIKEKELPFTRLQILQCYMIFGGIPYYWSFLQKGKSLSQNIDSILFADNAPLKDEFDHLYRSIFREPSGHIQIIKTLSQKKAGMTREELISAAGLQNSGALTQKLEELESCGFIRKYYAYGMKKKNAVYQLIDCFTLFYYQFLEKAPTDEHFWSNQINTPSANTWMGLAFERICLMHITAIKKKLGITGVSTEINSWYCKADPDKGILGSQIDLLIVRKDQVINLCEMKYSNSDFTITRTVDQDIRKKINDLQTATGTRYAIYPTLITTYGIVENSYSGNIQSIITMDDLFEKQQ